MFMTSSSPRYSRCAAERAEAAGLSARMRIGAWQTAWPSHPEEAMALLMRVWPAAVARAREEVADMQAIADVATPGLRIAAWDYRYYAEKVRRAKFDLDMNEVKPYLQLEKLREGMFWAARPPVRLCVFPGERRGRPGPRRARVGSQIRNGPAHRALVLRSLCAHRQEFRSMDERIPGTIQIGRPGFTHRIQQHQLSEE